MRRVVPDADPACGAPADGRTLVLTALGDFPASEVVVWSRRIDDSGPFSIDSFPDATRVLRVEVLGDAGTLRATGKSAPFVFDELEDGEQVTVFMAPPRGLCATGPPAYARAAPLVARAGDQVLVAGGLGADDTPVIPIERYQPSTGAFVATDLAHYGTGEHGLVGASLTSVRVAPEPGAATHPGLDDQPTHILLAGGATPAYQVYDAATETLSSQFFLEPARAYHAAVALDDQGRVLLAGGCSPLTDDHRCQPSSAELTTTIVDVARGQFSRGPTLARPRIRGTAVREGHDSILLVGGIDDQGFPVLDIERIHPSGAPGELLSGAGGAAVGLQSGSTLFGTGYPGGAADASLAFVPARAQASSPVAGAPWPLSQASTTALQDGRVLMLGVAPDGRSQLGLYQPASGDVAVLDTSRVSSLPGAEHGAVLFADGTVLVVGGRPEGGGAARAAAWIVRPDLIGPYASDMFLSFGAPDLFEPLIPRDPQRHETVAAAGPVPAHRVLRAGAGAGALPAEWLVVAGPIFTQGRLSARVRSLGGGVALMAGFRAADEYLAVVLAPGQPATAYRVHHGTATPVSECQGQVISASDLAPDEPALSVEIALELGGYSLRATLADDAVLTCTDLDDPVVQGYVGIGVVGVEDAGLRIDLLAVNR